jgi:hypothetical protein
VALAIIDGRDIGDSWCLIGIHYLGMSDPRRITDVIERDRQFRAHALAIRRFCEQCEADLRRCAKQLPQ